MRLDVSMPFPGDAPIAIPGAAEDPEDTDAVVVQSLTHLSALDR